MGDSTDSKQEWRPSDPHQIHNGVGKCLAVLGKETGERVLLEDCNGDSLQSFQYDVDTKLIQLMETDLCIKDVEGTDRLQLASCDKTSMHFKWDVAVLAA